MNPFLLSTHAFVSLREGGLLPEIERTSVEMGISSARTLVETSLKLAEQTAPSPAFMQELEQGLDDFAREQDFQQAVVRHGIALARHLMPRLGLERYPNEISEAAAIYLASEAHRHSQRGSQWSWRSIDCVNMIECHTHGDVSFSQHVIREEPLLFPALVASEIDSRGFTLKQDAAPLLISVLLFAEASGLRELPEIRNYREVIRRERANVWATPNVNAPVDRFAMEATKDFFVEKLLGSEPCQDVVHAYRFESSAETLIVPRLYNGALEFLCERATGSIRDTRLGTRN